MLFSIEKKKETFFLAAVANNKRLKCYSARAICKVCQEVAERTCFLDFFLFLFLSFFYFIFPFFFNFFSLLLSLSRCWQRCKFGQESLSFFEEIMFFRIASKRTFFDKCVLNRFLRRWWSISSDFFFLSPSNPLSSFFFPPLFLFSISRPLLLPSSLTKHFIGLMDGCLVFFLFRWLRKKTSVLCRNDGKVIWLT